MTAKTTPERAQAALRAFLDGEDVDADTLRAGLGLYRAQHLALERDAGQLADAWAEMVTLLTELGKQSAAISGMHYETHVADEWVAGHIIGEALTWRHVCSMLTMVVNAAHLRKAAVTGRQSGSEASGKAATGAA